MFVKIPDDDVLTKENNIEKSIFRKDILKPSVDIISKRRSIYIMGDANPTFFRSDPSISRIGEILLVNRSILNGHTSYGLGGDYRPNYIFLKSTYLMSAKLGYADVGDDVDVTINEHTLELTEMTVRSGYSSGMGVWTDDGILGISKSKIFTDLGKSIVYYTRLQRYNDKYNPTITMPTIGQPNRVSFDISYGPIIPDGNEEIAITVTNPIFYSYRHAEDNGMSPINVDGICPGDMIVDGDTHIRRVNIEGIKKKSYDKNGKWISEKVLKSMSRGIQGRIAGHLNDAYVIMESVVVQSFMDFISVLLQGLVYVFDCDLSGKISGDVTLIRPGFSDKYFPNAYITETLSETVPRVNEQFKNLSNELGPLRAMFSIEEYQINLTLILYDHPYFSKIEYTSETDDLINIIYGASTSSAPFESL